MYYDRVHQVVLVACPSSYVWLTPINVHVCVTSCTACVLMVWAFSGQRSILEHSNAQTL